MGDGEDQPWQRIRHALNDLAKGQQEIFQTMKSLTKSMAIVQGNQLNNVEGGSNKTLLGGSNSNHA